MNNSTEGKKFNFHEMQNVQSEKWREELKERHLIKVKRFKRRIHLHLHLVEEKHIYQQTTSQLNTRQLREVIKITDLSEMQQLI